MRHRPDRLNKAQLATHEAGHALIGILFGAKHVQWHLASLLLEDDREHDVNCVDLDDDHVTDIRFPYAFKLAGYAADQSSEGENAVIFDHVRTADINAVRRRLFTILKTPGSDIYNVLRAVGRVTRELYEKLKELFSDGVFRTAINALQAQMLKTPKYSGTVENEGILQLLQDAGIHDEDLRRMRETLQRDFDIRQFIDAETKDDA